MPGSKSNSTERRPSSFRALIILLVGALLFIPFSQVGCSRVNGLFAKSQSLSSVDLFKKVSPSVFVVQAFDESGKTLMLGSAVALGRDFLVTNCHVVQAGSSLKVSRGKEEWTARLIQAAPNHDLCGLRPNDLILQPVEVRTSSKLATGEHVYAVGSPEGLELTFSEGVISALRDTEGVHMIQTSAPISPGSSGGGLFDTQGNLVGITTFYLKEGQSLNFALPGEWISGILPTAGKSVNRPRDSQLESRAWLEIGLEAAKNENYDLTGPSFRKCANLKDSEAPRALLELGRLAELAAGLNSPSPAFEAWVQKYEISPRQAKALAITDFQQALALKPDYAEAWLELGKTQFGNEEFSQAIASFKEATRLAPNDWYGWALLGLSYTRQGAYTPAIEAFQQGEKVTPNAKKPRMLNLEGEAYAKKGDRAQILRIYQQLKGIDPHEAEFFIKLYALPARGSDGP